MNVLHVIHYPVFGGPHNQALRLNGALARRGWYTTVLLPDQPGNAAERLRAGGVEVIQLPLHRLRASPDPREQAALALGFLPEVDRIRRLIRRRSIDLVVVGGLANPHAAAAARLEGVPTVWQVLDSRTPAPLRLPLAALVPRLSDTVMAAGRTLLDLHFGPRGPGVPAFVYAPPVDTERFRPSPERRRAARRRLGIPTGAPVVGTVANLNPQKGLEHFVRAAALIHRARPDARFLLVGARYGSHRRYAALLEADVRASGLPPDRLIVTGERADVEEHYPAMDVHLITSVPRSEGTPTTALEAMACGVPVVATRVGAVAEAVEDGVTGLLVPPLDAGAIAGAALRLLEDAPLRDRLGAAGRERAVRRYGVEVCAETHHRAFQAARARFRARRAALMAARPDPLPPPELRSLLVCPACRGKLAWRPGGARCDGCGRTFPVVDGIPVMLLDGARAGHDEVDGHHHAHKERQAAFFDRGVAEEFEVARPHGAPALYRWLLGQKFRRSVRGLEGVLPGATVLTVCGGSGMDAEFLARAGARVVASDLSLGAARRTQERARRHGLPIVPLVADVERLPFADRSLDLVYVHDGLHHLERPLDGVGEMARVAAGAVSVTEPARALATAAAVQLGWALEREEAGNRVARLTPREVGMTLAAYDFRVLAARRYAMYYRHRPGPVMRALSTPGLFPAAAAGWRLANAVLGPFGNKLCVVARRPAAPPARPGSATERPAPVPAATGEGPCGP